MQERLRGALRWVALGLVAAWLIRSGTGGCSSTLPEPGTPAVPFEVGGDDLQGGRVLRLESFRGQAVVLVFFATWCGVCRKELPEIQRAVERNPGLRVVLLSEEDPGALPAWLASRQVRLPVGGGAGATLRAYGVRLLPSAVVVGADGRVLFSGEGAGGVKRALREAERAPRSEGEAGPRGEDGGLGDPEEGGGNIPRSACRGNPILC